MKLTNTIKNTIVNRVRTAYKEIHGKKFVEAENAFTEELYYQQFDQYQDLLEKLPKEWTYSGCTLYYYANHSLLDGIYVNDSLLYKFTGSTNISMPKAKLMICKVDNKYTDISTNENLVKLYRDMVFEATIYKQNYDNFMAQIRSVLSSVNTVNQLKTAWPECIQYLPNECLVKEKQLPVDSVTVLSINSKLGLLPNAHPANSD